MARLSTDSNHLPLSGDYNPQAIAFHASKIALVEDIIARRPHAEFKVERSCEAGRTDLEIEGDVEDVTNLLLTLHHYGAALFQLEAADQDELDVLREELAAIPAVSIEISEN